MIFTTGLALDATVEIRQVGLTLPPHACGAQSDVKSGTCREKLRFAVLHVDTHGAVDVARWNTSTRSFRKSSSDVFGELGLTRLVCEADVGGGRHPLAHDVIVESHPFPMGVKQAQLQGVLPAFLVPFRKAREFPVWTRLLDVARVAVGEKKEGGITLLLLLDVTRVQPDGTVVRMPRHALEELPQTVEQFGQCSVAVLHPREQNFGEQPGVYVRRDSGAMVFGRSSALVPASSTAHAPLPDSSLRRIGAPYYSCAPFSRADGALFDGETSFLEVNTKMTETSRAAMWAEFRASNPVMSVLAPMGATIGGAITSPMKSLFEFTLVDLKIDEGLTEQLVLRLTERVSPPVVSHVPPAIGQMLPDQLIETVPKKLSEMLVKSVPKAMVPLLTSTLVRGLTQSVPELVKVGTPLKLVGAIGPMLTTVLPKALTHTLVPALRRTLADSSRDIRCWYCEYDKEYGDSANQGKCGDCEAESKEGQSRKEIIDGEVENALYYAAFFSNYFSAYYAKMDFEAADMGVQNSQVDGSSGAGGVDYLGNQHPTGWRKQLVEG